MSPLIGRPLARTNHWPINELSLFRLACNDMDSPDLPRLADEVRRELTLGGRDALVWLATKPSADSLYEAVERGWIDREWGQALHQIQASMGLGR